MTTLGVVVGTYQHRQFIEECIVSIRNQSKPPDQIVVVDDGSTDGTQRLLRNLGSDIRFIELNRQGPSAVFNTGVAQLNTDFVAIISGDDRMLPTRLEKQWHHLETTTDNLSLARPYIIDNIGERRADSMGAEFFHSVRFTSKSLIRELFFRGNFFCAPTATFRRESYNKLGGFHLGLLQLQDFHLWIKFSTHGNVHLSNERLIEYRKSNQNLSHPRHDHRMHGERLWIYRHFFDQIELEQVRDIFGYGAKYNLVSETLLHGLIYLDHPDPKIRMIGTERLLDVLSDTDGEQQLGEIGMTQQEIFHLVNRYSPTAILGKS